MKKKTQNQTKEMEENEVKKMLKRNRGITLIALVVTIVVLIILATISINAVMGENGLIRKAEIAGEYQANAEAEDRANLGALDEHLANAIAGTSGNAGGTQTPTESEEMILEVETTGVDEEILFSLNTDTQVTVDFGDGIIKTYPEQSASIEKDKQIAKLASVGNTELKLAVGAPAIPAGDISVYHIYAKEGTHTIKILGDLDEIYYTENSIKSVKQWGKMNIERIYFQGAYNLESLAEPNENSFSANLDVTEAFAYCEGLTKVPVNLFKYCTQDYTFSGCSSLTSITIPASVTSIGYRTFNGCSDLTSITIPNSVTSIGDGAFGSCSGLTSITIPNSITSIGDSAFAYCSGLTSITIPNSVTSIGDSAFAYCSGLTNIIVAEENTKYDSRDNCNAIIEKNTNELIQGCKSTIIPASVTRIGNNAFSSCSGLTSITIPNSVTSIGYGAFDSCSGLTSITIPTSVTGIGRFAFNECSSLTSVTIDSTTIASSIRYQDDPENSYLVRNATTIYIKDTIQESSIGSYMTNTDNYTKAESDKEGYVKYTKK